MTATDAPAWAQRQQSERAETKAAHLVALMLVRDELDGIVKTRLAAALGISRWTLDRYLASLPEVEERVARIRRALADEAALQEQEREG